jgi:hypothetical protein
MRVTDPDTWDAHVRLKADDLDDMLMRPLYVLRSARGRWAQLTTMRGFERDDPAWHDRQLRSAHTRMVNAQREVARLVTLWVYEIPTSVQEKLIMGVPLDSPDPTRIE